MQFITKIDPEYLIDLKSQFIEPLRNLGFECQSYSEIGDKEQGTHILYFQHEHEEKLYSLEEINLLMVDDDSQPYSTFRLYQGSLWVYIPYLP